MINNDSYVVANNLPLVRRPDEGVLANDSDPNGGLFIPDRRGWFETTQGGAIYLVNDGSFAYLAPTGFSRNRHIRLHRRERHRRSRRAPPSRSKWQRAPTSRPSGWPTAA